MGINIMIAGLSTQVASLALFLALCGEFALRCYQHPYEWDPTYSKLRSTLKFKSFLVGKDSQNLSDTCHPADIAQHCSCPLLLS